MHQSFLYRKKSIYGTTSYWICCDNTCKARGSLKDGIFILNGQHQHEPDFSAIIQRQQNNLIKEKIIYNPNQTGLEIYNASTQALQDVLNISDEQLCASIKPHISVQPTISRAKNSLLPKLPLTREDKFTC